MTSEDMRYYLDRPLDEGFLEQLRERKRAKRHVMDESKPKTIRDYYIPMLSGRPVRDHAIDADDITNLKIALATATDIDGFIRSI